MSHTKRILPPAAFASALALAGLLIAAPIARAQQVAETTKPITSPTYRIATEDTLDISVVGQNGFGVPGQSRTVIVLADGTADLPYIGEKKIVGLTLDELRRKLLPAVKKELLNPAITIAVRGRYVKQINVYGVLPSKGKSLCGTVGASVMLSPQRVGCREIVTNCTGRTLCEIARVRRSNLICVNFWKRAIKTRTFWSRIMTF